MALSSASSVFTKRLGTVAIIIAGAAATTCLVAILVLVTRTDRTTAVLSFEMNVLRQAAALDALLYQKGFFSSYMVTGDRVWLEKLERTRLEFSQWAQKVRTGLSEEEAALLAEIERATDAYAAGGREAVRLFDAGEVEQAKSLIPQYSHHIDRLVALTQEFSRLGGVRVESALATAERSIRLLAWFLLGVSGLGALASLALGYVWARRVAKPMYELQVRVESAAQRARVRFQIGEDVPGIAEHIGALIAHIEETDEELLAHRRRLAQNEKLSEIGELAAKLAHEILNPLAGMKTTVQLMYEEASSAEVRGSEVRETAEALHREVGRVESLVRRLLTYARPLQPQTEVCSIESLYEAAVGSVSFPSDVRVSLDVERRLPPIEADPLLMTQVLTNLLRNAAESMPRGGAIAVRANERGSENRRQIIITVEDEGPGLTQAELANLFHPFFTTKVDGNGLGLAISRNIVVEHGGTIVARNRTDRSGAVFEVALPLVR